MHNYPYDRHCNVSSYLQKQPVTEGLHGDLKAVVETAESLGARSMKLVLEETAGSPVHAPWRYEQVLWCRDGVRLTEWL